jgi:hypothetical protein
LQMYAHWLIWIAALRAVTFTGSMWSLAIFFYRVRSKTVANPERSVYNI